MDVQAAGHFDVGKIRPGVYELVARGQAGVNDSYWLQRITANASEKTDVKVSSVEASCADEP
jgi:hypothetical protein